MAGLAHVAWTTIYSNRQSVAHEAGTLMTFSDLKSSYQDSLVVMDALVAALALQNHEISDLK
jgi:hypothetical protein